MTFWLDVDKFASQSGQCIDESQCGVFLVNFRTLPTPIDVDLVPVFEFKPRVLVGFHGTYNILAKNNWVMFTMTTILCGLK